MVAAFLGGLAVGVLLGLVLGPLLRYWLTWREWVEDAREAQLTEDVLRVMERGPWRLLRDRTARRPAPPAGDRSPGTR